MNGIFGGFLAIIDSIGGGFLYILVGEAASKSGAGARLLRLVIGALLLGSVISMSIYMMWPERALQKLAFQNNSFFNDNAIPLIFVPPVASLVLTAILEILRFGIEREPKIKRSEASSGLSITSTDRVEKPERGAAKQAA